MKTGLVTTVFAPRDLKDHIANVSEHAQFDAATTLVFFDYVHATRVRNSAGRISVRSHYVVRDRSLFIRGGWAGANGGCFHKI